MKRNLKFPFHTFQDWLSTEFEGMSATTQNTMVGSTWMNTMGAGAAMNGLPIQFCMPMARHLLQSVQMPTVTQVSEIDSFLRYQFLYSFDEILYGWKVYIAVRVICFSITASCKFTNLITSQGDVLTD